MRALKRLVRSGTQCTCCDGIRCLLGTWADEREDDYPMTSQIYILWLPAHARTTASLSISTAYLSVGATQCWAFLITTVYNIYVQYDSTVDSSRQMEIHWIFQNAVRNYSTVAHKVLYSLFATKKCPAAVHLSLCPTPQCFTFWKGLKVFVACISHAWVPAK